MARRTSRRSSTRRTFTRRRSPSRRMAAPRSPGVRRAAARQRRGGQVVRIVVEHAPAAIGAGLNPVTGVMQTPAPAPHRAKL